MHLVALRGAEITLARKSKARVRWTYPGWGWAAGEREELSAKRFLASGCAHLENPRLSLLFPPSFSGRKRGGSRKEMKPKLAGLEWKEEEEATKIR